MAVVSKLLLLVTLFIGIENAVSRSDYKSRELSFGRLPRSLENGKSSKSSKSGKKSGIGKGSKSPKVDKYLHADADLTVEYEIEEIFGSNKTDFKYVDTKDKPIKKSKEEKSYDKNDGVKSSKSGQEKSATKSSKAGKLSQKRISC